MADLDAVRESWGWLLGRLGYERDLVWQQGESWSLDGGFYVVLESGPDVLEVEHQRRPGLNHVAFAAGSQGDVDALVEGCAAHGWTLLFPDRHPHAGGPQHYAAYLEDAAGFEVELVADGG